MMAAQSMPSRSVLHSLAPEGVGTPLVESADSYVSRLAESHRVARSKLIGFVNEQGGHIYGDLKCQPPRLDSMTPQADAFMRRLADLTGRPEVQWLGLGWLSPYVTSHDVLREYRSWCPHCLKDAPDDGQPRCTPSIWAFRRYQRCVVHACLMEDRCSNCHGQMSVRRVRNVDGGSCCHCGADLGRLWDATRPWRLANAHNSEPLYAAMTKNIGHLLASAKSVASSGSVPDVRQLGRWAVEQERVSNLRHLARLAGVSLSSTTSRTMENSKPSLDVLLKLAVTTGISVAGALCPALWDADFDVAVPFIDPNDHRANRRRSGIDWDDVRMALEAELLDERALPIPAIALKLKVSAGYLRAKMPDLTQALIERHAQSRRQAREDGTRNLVERIRAVKRQLASAEGAPGRRAVARAVGEYHYNYAFSKAWGLANLSAGEA